MIKRLLPILLLLLVAACANYTLVPAGRTAVQGTLSVEPGIPWNRFERVAGGVSGSSNQNEQWTLNGIGLDSVQFFAGIADGQAMIKATGDGKETYPAFHKSMTASEIMDLFEATFIRSAKTTVASTRNLRTAKFGDVDGFRFEMSYVLKDEIDRELSAAGAVKNEKLYLIVYGGPKLYYYDRYLPEFDKLVATAQITK